MHQAGQDWLLSCASDPEDVEREWELDEFAEIPSGPHWRVAEAPLPATMSAIHRVGPDRIGPILGDVYSDTAWWLLPPDLEDDLGDVRLLKVHPAGWLLRCPPVLRSLRGRWWIERPDGSGRLTNPALLAPAFGSGAGSRLPSEGPR
ncbi:hypothetical protein [Streptomyces sp. NPDC046909]|uniref:hypothetical protein n=1 Tax=Streptomyces sp. NPDC046909 TaxID=3155617 RepID=UPI0034053D74